MRASPVPDQVASSPRSTSFTVLYGLLAVQLTAILAALLPRHNPDELALVLGCAVLAFGLLLVSSDPATLTWPIWRRLGVLAAQGIVTYLPLATLRTQWPGMTGFLAGTALILLVPRISWALFSVIIGSPLLAPPGLAAHPAESVYLMCASLGSGLTVYSVWRICLAYKRERRAGTELAQLTAVRERERFSRDLHDLLGGSLSAITLKTELTRRLVSCDPAQARDELAEVVDLARQAATDVRLVAHGYRRISLVREAATATSVLAAADIDVQVEIGCGVLDDQVDAVLATVLREAVTNVIRHSTARSCTIDASERDQAITLAVTNDGATSPGRRTGDGLENLAWRLGVIGGRLNTTIHPDGRFYLRATVPVNSPWPAVSGPRRRPSLRKPAPAPVAHRGLRAPDPATREELADQSVSSAAGRWRPAGQYRRRR
jgi:two-component system, NarL family, sensor histidine kinase DesK